MSDTRFFTLLAVIMLAAAFAAPEHETSVGALVVSCLFVGAAVCAWAGLF